MLMRGKKGFARFLRRRAGFTLVELMLVVIIIGIMVAMVMPRMAGRTEQARIAAAKADIEANISMALDMYEADNGKYPNSIDALFQNLEMAPNWKGPYLKKKPIDPWGNPYVYRYPGTRGDYDLLSYGKSGVEGGGDDITSWD